MSKINQTKIKYGVLGSLGILAVLALGVTILPASTNAYRSGYELRTDLERLPPQRIEVSPRPAIYSLNPNPVMVGSGSKKITINGGGFVYGAVAKINNSDRTTTFWGSNMLVMELTGLDTAYLGDYVITVSNPGPGGGLSNGYIFKVTYNISAISATTSVSSKSSTTSGNGSATVKKPITTPAVDTGEKESVSDLAAGALFGEGGFFPTSLIGWLLLAILILILVILARRIAGAKKYHEAPLKHA